MDISGSVVRYAPGGNFWSRQVTGWDQSWAKMREFGATHAGAVERHQQRASKQRPSCVDQS
jgi:hypothetical protein